MKCFLIVVAAASVAFGGEPLPEIVGSYQGVEARSGAAYAKSLVAGNVATREAGSPEDYVIRYYAAIHDVDVSGGAPKVWFESATNRGLTSVANGGPGLPRTGDILCSADGTRGHLAIVRNVADDSIHVIHQGWSNTAADENTPLTLTVTGGKFNIEASNGYTWQGLLRKK